MRTYNTFIVVIVLLAANLLIFPFSISAQSPALTGLVVDMRIEQQLSGVYARRDKLALPTSIMMDLKSLPGTQLYALTTPTVLSHLPASQGGTLTVTPVTVTRGGVVTVSWRGIADPATNDWIGVYKTDAGDRQYSGFFYTGSDGSPRAAGSHAFTMPTEPGTYEFRLFAKGGYTRLAKSSTVTVSAPQGGTLTVTPATVDRGGVVTVSWRGVSYPAPNDWIGLYKTDAEDRQHSGFFYTGSDGSPRAAGSHAFTMPSEPGTYEFRLFAMGGYTRLAKSPTVTVSAPHGGTLTVTPATVDPSGVVTVSWRGVSNPAPNDWIGLYKTDAEDRQHSGYFYTGSDGSPRAAGSHAFTMPGEPGTYEFRLFAMGGYTRLAKSPTINIRGTVTPQQPSPTQARFTVEVAKRNLSQGGSVTVPVSLNNVEALANMNVNIHYDPAVVRPVRNADRGNIIPQALFEANVRDRGVIRLGFAQANDIRGTGTLAQIPFEAVGRPGTRTPLRLEVTMASAAAGSRVTPAQLIHGEIVIVGADGRLPGDTSGSGSLTALDAMNALKMSVGNLAVDMVADVDRDGSVTARDATLILQQVVGR